MNFNKSSKSGPVKTGSAGQAASYIYSRCHLSEHAGTKECSYWISETIQFVYKAEHFPFNAQQDIYEYHYFGGSDN